MKRILPGILAVCMLTSISTGCLSNPSDSSPREQASGDSQQSGANNTPTPAQMESMWWPERPLGPPAPISKANPAPLASPGLLHSPTPGAAGSAPLTTPIPTTTTQEASRAKKQRKLETVGDKQRQVKEAEETTEVEAQRPRRVFSLSQLRRKYSDSFIFRGKLKQKKIALTFDDAPDDQYTPQILDVLKRYGVRGTFFVVGSHAAEHPEMITRMVREGHVVGNHTYRHALLRKLPQNKFIQEIQRTDQVLTPLLGYNPRLVRPPYGAINDEELAWLKEQGYLTVNWNVDPEDWRGLDKSTILQRSLEGASPGAIILLHAATGAGGNLRGTVDALPAMIESLQAKGYDLVTLPQLLGTSKAR